MSITVSHRNLKNERQCPGLLGLYISKDSVKQVWETHCKINSYWHFWQNSPLLSQSIFLCLQKGPCGKFKHSICNYLQGQWKILWKIKKKINHSAQTHLMHSFICCDYVSERVISRGCRRTLCDLSSVWFACAVSLHLQVLAYKWFHSWANTSVRNPSSPVLFCCLPVKSDTAPHCYVQPNQPLHIPSAYERFFASLLDTKEQLTLDDNYTITFECEPCLSSGSCSQMILGSCELPWLIVKHVLVNQTYPSGSSSTGTTMSCLSRSSQRGVTAAHLPGSRLHSIKGCTLWMDEASCWLSTHQACVCELNGLFFRGMCFISTHKQAKQEDR